MNTLQLELIPIGVILAVALFVIVSGQYPPEVVNGAFGFVGLILGYLLETPLKRDPPSAV